MNHTEHNSPLRDITGWATSEDLPPQNLFESIEDYRTFVRRWKALYKEQSVRSRAGKAVGKYEHALWQIDYQGKFKNKLGLIITPGIRSWRKAQAERAREVLAQPKSEDYQAYEAYEAGHYSASGMIMRRLAGKRWVKHYHPWTSRSASCQQTVAD